MGRKRGASVMPDDAAGWRVDPGRQPVDSTRGAAARARRAAVECCIRTSTLSPAAATPSDMKEFLQAFDEDLLAAVNGVIEMLLGLFA
jgi:hypothetical protein